MDQDPVRPYSVTGRRVVHVDGRRGIQQDGGDGAGRVPVLWGVTSVRTNDNANVPKPIITMEALDDLTDDPERIVPPDIVQKRRAGKLTDEERATWVK